MADGSFLLCNINIWWNFGVKNQESIATAFYANFEIRKYRHPSARGEQGFDPLLWHLGFSRLIFS